MGFIAQGTLGGGLAMKTREFELVVDKHQAAQLIEVLQRWVDGEGVE